MIRDLILRNRSYRRFDQNIFIEKELLIRWTDLARMGASGMNNQPLKYIISNDFEKNERIFETLKWAGYLKDWDGPISGERPSAYIIQMLDTQIAQNYFCDDGIAAQNILLGAVEKGFGGCILRAIDREKLSRNLSIPKRFQIINVIALGKPIEIVQLEEIKDGDVKYWRDKDNVHHVPKRPLSEIILDL